MQGFIIKVFQNIFDEFTNSLSTLDSDHKYIHSGIKYGYSENISITTGNTYVITFKTPTVASGKNVHFRPDIVSSSGDKLLIELLENNTLTAAGTSVTSSLFNYNRQSANTSNMQTFAKNATIDSAGTTILTSYIGGGTNVGGNKGGDSVSNFEERVLKQNTQYAIKFTNNSSSTNIVNTLISWYEEGNI